MPMSTDMQIISIQNGLVRIFFDHSVVSGKTQLVKIRIQYVHQ